MTEAKRRRLVFLLCWTMAILTAGMLIIVASGIVGSQSNPSAGIESQFAEYLKTSVPGATVTRDKYRVVYARYRTKMYTTKTYYNSKLYLNQQEGPLPGGFLVQVWASHGYRPDQLGGSILDCEFPGDVAVGVKRTFASVAPPGVTPTVVYAYAFYRVAPHTHFYLGGFGPEPPMPSVVAHLLEIARDSVH